jgi:hypothetical protein
MNDGITVKEFKYIPGVNDAEYIKKLEKLHENDRRIINTAIAKIKKLSAQLKEQPEIIRCHECKHNPLKEWFSCPMAHLDKQQRPEDAWCWKGERET